MPNVLVPHHGWDCTVGDDAVHCYIHGTDEIIDADTYIVCFECKHVWTKQALVEAAIRSRREYAGRVRLLFARKPKAEEIFFCQECLHDF